nr:immunoglobulin light chain junction region [Macaca mulatta]MOY10470.1 immunoglobulin light chain junction region [Macaca mulatta]MOY10548.1 immunoglobulin light chain junction region [Macaca mulatta]MOY10555.1 immunoglobulin light chain junction region [Macaca mulatta]MOY10698.1 immunoglobulin light chain junction region [Macaca mulatta]
CQQSHRSPPTF